MYKLQTKATYRPQDITFSYKRSGQKYQVTDAVGTRTFAYNAALQPTTETIAGGLYSKTLTNNYSSTGYLGRYTGMNISAEYVKTLGYDTYGRLNSLSDGTDTFSYSFVANSDLVASVTRPHNLTTDYAYEANRNLTDYIENKYNTTSISKYDYTNDDIGRRTAKSRTGTAFATADSITFGYNDRSEVSSAVSNNIAAYNYGFTFDNIGNRGSSTIAGTTATYTANNLNQYTAITQGSTINPTYNADGCITSIASTNGTWNGENRLIEIYDDTAGYKLEFVYDYMGRRVEKKVYTGSSTTSWTLSTHEKFVYDGYKLIEVLDGQNSDAILQKFLWSGEELLSVYDAAATDTYYYFADANKNIGQLMDSSGNTVAKYEYSPFGVQTSATGAYAATNPFGFSSEYYDSETQLVYYNYRYYSPTLGRWLSRDPVNEKGGFNLYGMVNNNIINLLDLLGLSWCKRNIVDPAGSVLKGLSDLLIGDDWGAAWGGIWDDTFGEEFNWAGGMSGGYVPGTVNGMLWTTYNNRPIDSAENGHNAWHAQTNAFVVQELGLVAAPLIIIAGILHETPLDLRSFKLETNQGIVNHSIDAYTDIIANMLGLTLGALQISPKTVGKIGNCIPGPPETAKGWK